MITSLEYRNKVRQKATLIRAAGKAKMREHWNIIEAALQFHRFYRLDYFKPYDYQFKWFESGIYATLRYLSAANQIGKTYGGAVEMTYHLTGLYPDWWPGRHFEVTGKEVCWAMGVSLESTRKVLQNYLLGTDNAKKTREFGSGTIPREMIRMETLVRDGELVKSISIDNAAGGYCELYFYASTQSTDTLHGQKVLYIWLDEQPDNELELSSIFAARTINTGGIVAVTATPEKGATDLWRQCKEDNSPHVHFQSATWDDAPHLSEEAKDRILAAIPYHEREMRSKGIPVAGIGAIYPYRDDDITCEPFDIPDHWLVLAPLDFGVSGNRDPSIILSMAYDPDTGVRYVFAEWSSEMDKNVYANSYMPDFMAHKIIGQKPDDWDAVTKSAPFVGIGLPGIVVKSPHDGANTQPGTNQTRCEIMRDVGANVDPRLWELPPDMAPLEKNRRSLAGSIAIAANLFRDGKLKIFTTCTETLRERRGYQWIKKGQKTVPIDKDNHFMDAMRIGAIRISYDGEYMQDARQPIPNNTVDGNPYETDMGAYHL